MALDISDKNLGKYYAYLRDILYDPKNANINLDELPDKDNRDFAEALMQFGVMATETREFAFSLSRGELDGKQPFRGNELAAPLKSLHATLKHLTWQAMQISGGDYDQRIDFMGDFSIAFNNMVAQLAERRRQMENEAENNKKRMEELAKANSILEAITSNMEEWIVMVDRATGERIFANHPAETVLASGIFERQLYGILFEYAVTIESDDEPRKEVFSLISDTAQQYFEMMLYPIRWVEHDAVACVLTDITASKEEYNRLEDAAYKDMMTGVYNRLFGMKLLDRYTQERISYKLIFVDMDMLKYVNDVFGHTEGDAYIKSVADLLQEVSASAIVCRLGGDEFMVIITERDARGYDMNAVLENLRDKLARSTAIGEDGQALYHRSISFGIKTVDENNKMPVSDILAEADEIMYEYKKAHKQERRI